MLQVIGLLLASILRCFRARRSLLIENLVLRQQLVVLKRKHPRPRLTLFDKGFWVLIHKIWPGWKQTLIVVSPETVMQWHRSGFALYWRAISRARRVIGRKPISQEVRELIFRMVAENPTWRAPQRKDPDPRLLWNCTYLNFKQSSARSSDPLGERPW